MRKRYIVTSGHGHCGIHPGSTKWHPCKACERAAAATAAALAGVIPSTGGIREVRAPTPDHVAERIRELYADGRSFAAISRETGVDPTAVQRICHGLSHNKATKASIAVVGSSGASGFGGAARRRHYAERQAFVGYGSK
jgi:hypothetical protein